jgi:hypothetical protein
MEPKRLGAFIIEYLMGNKNRNHFSGQGKIFLFKAWNSLSGKERNPYFCASFCSEFNENTPGYRRLRFCREKSGKTLIENHLGFIGPCG